MTARRGGFAAWIVGFICVIGICASAFFAVGFLKNRSADAGFAALKAEDYETAAENFKRAARFALRPDAEILIALAKAQEGCGDTKGAKESYARATQADNNDPEPHYALGKIYISEKNFGEAEKEIKALEDIGTDSAKRYADELRTEKTTGAVTGAIDNIFKNVIPKSLPDLFKKVLPSEDK
ncbi:MAG: tetratricopeptide repeat protein [Synergistes sp.]|nr:tetratricopeptide repeat protein [Synergistes sp.]